MRPRAAWIWIFLGAGAAGLHFALGRDSSLAESLFSRGLYAAWRRIWDDTLGLSPLPWLYIFAACLLAALIAKISGILFRRRTKEPSSGSTKKLGRAVVRIASWAGALVFFFYILWGFNYNRVGLEKQLGLDPSPLAADALAAEASWASRMASESRASISGATAEVLRNGALPESLESDIRRALVPVLRKSGYPASGRVRVREFVPGGWMMRFSGTGVYIPYCGEGYIADNLLPFEKPFTMAHEMAHGYGIADEAGANFLAYLACASSPLPIVRYSGYAAYWSTAAGELPRAEFKTLWEGLPEGMKADLRAAQANAARYHGALDRISRKVYAQYLKTQGIADGLRSYSRFVGLVAAWKKKGPDTR